MKNFLKCFIILCYIVYGSIIFADEYANRMNAYDNTITPDSVQKKDFDELSYIKNVVVNDKHSNTPSVEIFLRYETTFNQLRIIYQCNNKLFNPEDAITSTRDCILDFMKDNNFKHYQDIRMPQESSKIIEENDKKEYVTQYMRYVKLYN